jgi:hypothetical protein
MGVLIKNDKALNGFVNPPENSKKGVFCIYPDISSRAKGSSSTAMHFIGVYY